MEESIINGVLSVGGPAAAFLAYLIYRDWRNDKKEEKRDEREQKLMADLLSAYEEGTQQYEKLEAAMVRHDSTLQGLNTTLRTLPCAYPNQAKT